MSWARAGMYCPLCGHKLECITPEVDEDGFPTDSEPDEFLCHNKRCAMYAEGPGEGGELVCFSPINGWQSPPGDSWAIGWIK